MAYSIFRLSALIFFVSLSSSKSIVSGESNEKIAETRHIKISDGPAMVFADEFRQTLERYIFGICPQTFRMQFMKSKNSTVSTPACDLDPEHHDLAARLATLSIRAHTATRTECSRLGVALANMLGELARTANRAAMTAANNEAVKKRKLSKSQKAKIQAKQRTALAVKKKAAAVAAAAAAKMTS
ncbi:hypothetical protein ACJJTC_002645 [Scirpophaga incertulas]